MADQTNLGKVYTHFQAKTAKKTTPFGAAHAYMAYIRKYPPGGLLVAVPFPRQRKNGGRVWLHVGYPPGLAQCKQVFVYYTGAIWYSVDMPLPTHKTHGCLVDLFTDTAAILNQLELRSGGHEHDPIHSLSIYARFSGQFFFQFS